MIDRYPTLESRKTPDHRFIFLCGLSQSGRFLVHRALKAHPDISGFENTGAPDDEGELLQNVYPKSRSFGGPGKFCLAEEAYLTETSPLITNENRVRLFAQWQPYWDVHKPFLLEKSAPNLIQSRFLQAMFPRSVFVFVVRHPIAAALAMHKMGLEELPALLSHWSRGHAAMLADRKQLSQHILLRYEDILARPEHCFRILYGFLGLPYQPPEAIPTDISTGREHFARWEEYRLTHAAAYQRMMDHAATPARLGYVLDTPYVRPVMIDRGVKS